MGQFIKYIKMCSILFNKENYKNIILSFKNLRNNIVLGRIQDPEEAGSELPQKLHGAPLRKSIHCPVLLMVLGEVIKLLL